MLYVAKKVLIASIKLQESESSRAEKFNSVVIEDYADKLSRGVAFPPVVLYEDVSGLWVSDGFQLISAHIKLSDTEVEAMVFKGGKQDALRDSLSRHSGHGMRYTNEDKNRTVELALKDPIVNSPNKPTSHRQIAIHCCVSPGLVDNVCRELGGAYCRHEKQAGDAQNNAAVLRTKIRETTKHLFALIQEYQQRFGSFAPFESQALEKLQGLSLEITKFFANKTFQKIQRVPTATVAANVEKSGDSLKLAG